MSLNLAYYRKSDWSKLIEMIDDPEKMHDTWEESYQDFLKVEKQLKSSGFLPNRIVIDLDELKAFCVQKGLKIDGKARSLYVSSFQ
ncbi:hypothetical protein [Algoriphagus algorifonticola]|uniref:hypothetical protein n=1 Tax=Algoriphagus algorifonticola TaxID=2593007 RepID=UPI0011A920C2|nr:hypothetical protein [Algoriphagus algorifonticola]